MWPLTDITVYYYGTRIQDSPQDWTFRKTVNYVSDFYHNSLNGYKPPKRTQTIAEVTGDARIDSLINIHFPKGRTAEYGLEAHPVSEEFTIPDDFLNNGVWFRRTYKYTADDLHLYFIA